MKNFLQALALQRWDDHRYYHHSRVNQSLHLVSALSFLWAYLLMFKDPVAAALVGWLVSMSTRQIGHFFFEPTGYDQVNDASHAHKEAIKVGYNLQRKIVLIAIWAAVPVVLLLVSLLRLDLWGQLAPAADLQAYARQVGAGWLVLAVGGLLFRTLQLFVVRDLRTGLVWLTKILTDPFHDIWLYHKAPLALLRGELIDPHHASRPLHAGRA